MTSIAEGVFGDGDATDAVDDAARPYGFLGLVVSTVLILLATLIVLMVVSLVALLVFAASQGWANARDDLQAAQTWLLTDQQAPQRLGVIVSLVIYAALSAVVLVAARIRGGRGWRGIIAWRPWHPFRAARLFWILVPAIILYSFAADALIAHYYPASKDWIALPKGPLWVGLFVLLAVVFAPLTEELLFRGWIHTSLRRTIGVWASILVTSLLFAVAHWEKSHLYALAVLPVGLALGYLRERTGSLKASIAFHALYNGAASVLLIFT